MAVDWDLRSRRKYVDMAPRFILSYVVIPGVGCVYTTGSGIRRQTMVDEGWRDIPDMPSHLCQASDLMRWACMRMRTKTKHGVKVRGGQP
jgi:hypothetical protein